MNQITIATYNICHGRYAALDWSRLAAVIRESGADLVGLQEIDEGTQRIGGQDSLEALRKALGFADSLFVPAMDYDGGQYGTAILSRFPMKDSRTVRLSSASYEPRSFGCVTVQLPDSSPMILLNTHLSYESHEQQTVQAEEIRRWVDKNLSRSVPTLLTGDFNTDDLRILSPVLEAGFIPVNTPRAPFLTFRPDPIAIDNILYRGPALIPEAAGMIDSDASDHNLLWCRFRVN